MKGKTALLCILVLTSGLHARAQDYSALRIPALRALPDSLKGKSLAELADIFDTDKKTSVHNFVEIYERYFKPIRGDVERVFEIGIADGASHKMWKSYFDSSEVYGIDIFPTPWVEQLGIHTYVADQGNREQLQGFIDTYGGEFDVIVDDGGHWMNHQQVSLGFLFKHLRPGGLYFIEDVHTSIPAFVEGFGKDSTLSNTTLTLINDFVMTEKVVSTYMLRDEMEYLEQHIDFVELSKRNSRFHSTLCVIRKKTEEGR